MFLIFLNPSESPKRCFFLNDDRLEITSFCQDSKFNHTNMSRSVYQFFLNSYNVILVFAESDRLHRVSRFIEDHKFSFFFMSY